ncbi:MAG: M20 family metallopeptidase [Candidatus Aenigmarchaeota archaeon]|nr:M20 family metallopeptidase [Candidatus Aenigmarchaeota archaeon]
MIQKERIITLTQQLIRAKSENPPGEEYEAAMIVKREMEDIGLDVSVHEFSKNRPNIIGILKGKNLKRSLLLTPHTDVVPAGTGWKHEPYSAKLIDGKIYGRGASDCKGHVAVCLEVARSIIESKKNIEGDLIVAAVVDEEQGSEKGIKALIEKKVLKPTHAVAVDVGDFKIITAQKGVLFLSIELIGKKAHGAYPDKGINAIEAAAKIIIELKEHKFACKKHPYFKTESTVNIGKITGGNKANIVADNCVFDVDMRYLPGTKKEEIILAIEELIKKHIKNYEISIKMHELPFEEHNQKLISAMKKAYEKNSKQVNITGSAGATVISLFKKYDIPAIATGFCNGDCMHINDEFVVADDLVKGAKILEDFALELLNNP